MKNKPEDLTTKILFSSDEKKLYYHSKHENLMIYQYFWFTSAFLDAGEKFSPSIRGTSEILTQDKTDLTNMIDW